jgi:hypothetical protein
MARFRNRCETCPYCHKRREVTVNLDEKHAVAAILPGMNGASFCIKGDTSCIEEMRDKALLAPFADGKTRVR